MTFQKCILTTTKLNGKTVVQFEKGEPMNMKGKLLALGLSCTLLLSLAACSSSGSNSSTSQDPSNSSVSTGSSANTSSYGEFTTLEEGKLIMATNCAFPPYTMVADDDGVAGTGYEGIDVEIAAAVAEKLGLELQIDDMEFTSALLAVQNNSADMIFGALSYREDRDEVMDFTDPYATGVQVVIVPEGSDITTLDDLNGKLIGTQAGTTGYTYASASPEENGFGEENVRAYDNGATAVQALLGGQIDAVIIDDAPARQYVAANDSLTILDTPWVEEEYCAAVDEGNTALLHAINTALNELMDDGTVQSIQDKYISAD